MFLQLVRKHNNYLSVEVVLLLDTELDSHTAFFLLWKVQPGRLRAKIASCNNMCTQLSHDLCSLLQHKSHFFKEKCSSPDFLVPPVFFPQTLTRNYLSHCQSGIYVFYSLSHLACSVLLIICIGCVTSFQDRFDIPGFQLSGHQQISPWLPCTLFLKIDPQLPFLVFVHQKCIGLQVLPTPSN